MRFSGRYELRVAPRSCFSDDICQLTVQDTRVVTPYDFAIGILFGLGGALLATVYFLIGRIVTAVFRVLSSVLDSLVGLRWRIFVVCIVGGTLVGFEERGWGGCFGW
jgi:hypothetical protein